jgi:hypothetical protein
MMIHAARPIDPYVPHGDLSVSDGLSAVPHDDLSVSHELSAVSDGDLSVSQGRSAVSHGDLSVSDRVVNAQPTDRAA